MRPLTPACNRKKFGSHTASPPIQTQIAYITFHTDSPSTPAPPPTRPPPPTNPHPHPPTHSHVPAFLQAMAVAHASCSCLASTPPLQPPPTPHLLLPLLPPPPPLPPLCLLVALQAHSARQLSVTHPMQMLVHHCFDACSARQLRVMRFTHVLDHACESDSLLLFPSTTDHAQAGCAKRTCVSVCRGAESAPLVAR